MGQDPRFNPWPQVSPFQNRFEQTYNHDGYWMHEVNNEPRQYYFTTQALFARMRKPEHSIIGARGVPEFSSDFRVLADDDDEDAVIFPLFPFKRAGDAFRHSFKSEGVDLRWGYRDPGLDAGLEVGGFWISDVTMQLEQGNNPELPSDFSSTNSAEVLEFVDQLRNTSGIPIDDGQGGSTAPYDRFFRLSYSQEAFGAHVILFRSPSVRKSWLKVRTMYGLKYLHIQENFGFAGGDSGLEYEIINDPEDENFGRPDPSTIDLTDPTNNVPPYESYLNSWTRSHLVGPQIGLGYEFGGDSVMVTGRSLFAVMANHERINLDGDDFGDGFNNPFDQTVDNSFSQQVKNTHISPAFTQEFHVDMRLLQLLPVVNRIRHLENSVLRVSYNYTVVGSVARPASSIRYNGLPLFPEINTSRSAWDFYSIGVGFNSTW